ncbi:MAG: beta-N-acetylhexosaminidase [Nitrospinaceae bacterium]|nr:beta-N-acetylhexosaminidase [Nitrospinaceae bacterium]NIR57044.1 beta-N-acetylhexosaminidase [Nitrospinaceae bacterium]NIS87499.1 beta-N-acetylhexosaminidase [Nitrospinaceae bacterium]NIT84353.1 beta-N-acetylhexosaminidase [Nitrospinaceae bacterium]NIU46540.1 beta-N-acetylhexosaminidase [Nitrospinaceae bacterium]
MVRPLRSSPFLNIPASIREQTGQMLMVGFEGTTLTPETRDLIQNHHVGGLILFGRNYEHPQQLYALIRDIQETAAASSTGLPLFISVDQEGGKVARLKEPFTPFPPFCCVGHAPSGDLAYRLGKTLAAELAAAGINMDYAPVLDVNTNPDNPIIGDRAISPDPQCVADRALHFMTGFRDAGMIPVGKHFPGHGDTKLDSHLDLPYVDRDAAVLEAVELLPFRETIARGLEAIMTAHVIYTAWDDKLPATFSPLILQNILRQKLGFDGVIISDDLEMKAVENYFAFETFAQMGVAAGLDVFLVCHNQEKIRSLHDHLIRGVESGDIDDSRIRQSVERIVRLKQQIPKLPPNPPNPESWQSHRVLAEEMASARSHSNLT